MKKRIQQLLAIALLLIANGALAQVTGVVTNLEDGETMVGVSVVKKGTSVGTITDIDGSYSIAANNGDILVFSFVGMAMQEVKVTGKVANVGLTPDVQALEEVMVVAYGTSTKKSFTGSASTVKGKDIAKLQTSNVTTALEGAAAGVQFASNSGQPGSGGGIRIRGIGSISAGTSPLYVVDGMPYEGEISSISPSDIESMTVLKDAAANSLYGSRASNGVILITTKKGQSGKARITVDARVGVNQRAVPDYDVMTDPGMFYQMTWEAMRNDQYYRMGYSWAEAGMYASKNLVSELGGYNSYYTSNDRIIDPATGKVYASNQLAYKENWADEMFNQGTRQEYNVAVAGASEKTSYYLSFGYLNDGGYVVNSDFTRYTARLRLERELASWIKLGSNMTYVNKQSKYVSEGGADATNMFFVAQNMAPIYPVYLYDPTTKQRMYDSKGNRRYDFGNEEDYQRPVSSMSNVLASQSLDKDNTSWNIFNGKFFVDLKWRDFKFTVNYGIDVSDDLGLVYKNGEYGQFKEVGGSSTRYGERLISQVSNELLTWTKDIDKHNIDVLLGHEFFDNTYNAWSGSKQNFYDPDQVELIGATDNPSASSQQNSYKVESFISRVQYNYDSKYYASASLRRDGSSRFHKDNRWGNFWSVGASWRMKDEDFLYNVDWLNDLKLKASYGTQGNDNLGVGGVAPWANQFVVTPSNDGPALVDSYKGNENISWEKSGTFNIGVEYGLFNKRLFGSVEYFYKKTTDILFNRPQPISSGDASYPDNVGDMVNKGIEIDMNGVIVKTNDWEWTINFNATHFTNVVTKLPPERRQDGIDNGRFKMMEGKSIYEYCIKDYAGVSSTGEAQWYMDVKDANGNITGVTTTTDYSQATDYFQGNALPKVYGGISTSVSFKGIDFSVQTAYQLGGRGYDGAYAYMMAGYEYGTNMHKDLLNRWTPTNTNTDVPRLQIGNQSTDGGKMSSRWFVSSNFFNIKNITLGYTLPKSLVKRAFVESCRVYAVVDNVYFFSARQGYDPRTSWSGGSSQGLYAPVRTMSLGLNLSF